MEFRAFLAMISFIHLSVDVAVVDIEVLSCACIQYNTAHISLHHVNSMFMQNAEYCMCRYRTLTDEEVRTLYPIVTGPTPKYVCRTCTVKEVHFQGICRGNMFSEGYPISGGKH